MDPLRLALLIIGSLIVAGILLWGWQQSRGPRPRGAGAVALDELDADGLVAERQTPGDLDLDELRGLGARKEPVAVDDVAEAVQPQDPASQPGETGAPPRSDTLLISIAVIATHGHHFAGDKLLQVFDSAGLFFGDMKIFHAPVDLERPDGPALFSIADAVEPGTLEPERLRGGETPGIILFVQLPTTVQGTEVLEHMIATGRYLARSLDGQLCDVRRQPLTEETVAALRRRIIDEIGDRTEKPDEFA